MIFSDINAFRASGFTPRICIIGSGPAGITLARKLAQYGVPVVVLEAGENEYTDKSQDFYRGRTIGDPYFDLDVTRLRFLGGSSNHWAGWCRPLDAHDFEAKPHVPDSGWPIGRDAIEPHFEEVREILDLVPLRPDVPVSDDIRWIQLIKSPAVHFGEKFNAELRKSDNIAVVLNTSVELLEGDGKRINGAKVFSAGQPAGQIAAECYIVCTGGLENSRLLLWSNEMSNGAVVPHGSALGRYWMEHPHFQGGNALLTSSANFERDGDGEAFFSPSPEAINSREILNFGIRLIDMPYQGAKQIVAELACLAPSVAEWAAVSLGSNLRCASQLVVNWEQAPLASNQVALSKESRDKNGVPRIELHWKKDLLDRRTFHEGLRLFGETLATKDLGRVRIDDWVAAGEFPTDHELAGHHHMGGTRMGTDVSKSVVDADCKVHGIENLYVGGSSIFATSGQANPTTTIVAFSLRLGEHLRQKLIT